MQVPLASVPGLFVHAKDLFDEPFLTWGTRSIVANGFSLPN
jgi:hypothetical protein